MAAVFAVLWFIVSAIALNAYNPLFGKYTDVVYVLIIVWGSVLTWFAADKIEDYLLKRKSNETRKRS